MTAGTLTLTQRRACSGSLLRGFVTWTVENGLADEVAALAGPEARQLLDTPVDPDAWVDEAGFDGIVVALARATNLESVRRMGYETTWAANSVLMRPMLKAVLALFGATPAVLFSNMDKITGAVLRGVSSTWTPQGPTSGLLEVRFATPAPLEAFVPFEGAFLFVFDLCRVTGTVGHAQLAPDARSATFDIGWEA